MSRNHKHSPAVLSDDKDSAGSVPFPSPHPLKLDEDAKPIILSEAIASLAKWDQALPRESLFVRRSAGYRACGVHALVLLGPMFGPVLIGGARMLLFAKGVHVAYP